jgi:hypothetical protein
MQLTPTAISPLLESAYNNLHAASLSLQQADADLFAAKCSYEDATDRTLVAYFDPASPSKIKELGDNEKMRDSNLRLINAVEYANFKAADAAQNAAKHEYTRAESEVSRFRAFLRLLEAEAGLPAAEVRR